MTATIGVGGTPVEANCEWKGPVFIPFPKIGRLNRTIVITEKLDGTNAAVGVTEDGTVYAQSRTRIITPGKHTDNMGFATYVAEFADVLRQLGPGIHFGEWWGRGIQRGYGLSGRRFSLFNVARWTHEPGASVFAAVQEKVNISLVPVLYEGPWIKGSEHIYQPDVYLEALRRAGSVAAPGFMQPEGIVVFHKATGQLFKATCEKDEAHKTVAEIAAEVMARNAPALETLADA